MWRSLPTWRCVGAEECLLQFLNSPKPGKSTIADFKNQILNWIRRPVLFHCSCWSIYADV